MDKQPTEFDILNDKMDRLLVQTSKATNNDSAIETLMKYRKTLLDGGLQEGEIKLLDESIQLLKG